MASLRLLAAVLVAAGSGGCSLLLDFDGPVTAEPDGGAEDAGGGADAEPGEPNDSFAEATPIGPGTHGPFRVAPASDLDFFSFQVPAGAPREVTVSALFSQASGDLDLRLFDSREVLVAGSTGFVDNEQIVTSLGEGTYYAEVYSFGGVRGNEYTLVLAIP